MMFASCNRLTALIGYTFLLIAGVFAALSVNYYNRGTDHSQFRTIMNYVAIGVLGLLSVLAATVVFAPFLKSQNEKRKTSRATQKARAAETQRRAAETQLEKAKREANRTRFNLRQLGSRAEPINLRWN